MPLASRFVRENESLPLSPSLAGYTRGNPSFYKLVAHRGWPDSKPGWPRPRRRAEPSRAEPSRPKVRSFALPRILRLTARAERSGGERIGSSPPSPSPEYIRARSEPCRGCIASRRNYRARCSSSAGRRAFFLPAFSALSAARGMRNLEERSSPRLASPRTSRLASSRLASPRFASFRLRPCVPSSRACFYARVSLSFSKNLAEFRRKEDGGQLTVVGRGVLCCCLLIFEKDTLSLSV